VLVTQCRLDSGHIQYHLVAFLATRTLVTDVETPCLWCPILCQEVRSIVMLTDTVLLGQAETVHMNGEQSIMSMDLHHHVHIIYHSPLRCHHCSRRAFNILAIMFLIPFIQIHQMGMEGPSLIVNISLKCPLDGPLSNLLITVHHRCRLTHICTLPILRVLGPRNVVRLLVYRLVIFIHGVVTANLGLLPACQYHYLV